MINNNIFTFPLNPPLAKGDLWQGVALLAYGDGGYSRGLWQGVALLAYGDGSC